MVKTAGKENIKMTHIERFKDIEAALKIWSSKKKLLQLMSCSARNSMISQQRNEHQQQNSLLLQVFQKN